MLVESACSSNPFVVEKTLKFASSLIQRLPPLSLTPDQPSGLTPQLLDCLEPFFAFLRSLLQATPTSTAAAAAAGTSAASSSSPQPPRPDFHIRAVSILFGLATAMGSVDQLLFLTRTLMSGDNRRNYDQVNGHLRNLRSFIQAQENAQRVRLEHALAAKSSSGTGGSATHSSAVAAAAAASAALAAMDTEKNTSASGDPVLMCVCVYFPLFPSVANLSLSPCSLFLFIFASFSLFLFLLLSFCFLCR